MSPLRVDPWKMRQKENGRIASSESVHIYLQYESARCTRKKKNMFAIGKHVTMITWYVVFFFLIYIFHQQLHALAFAMESVY